MKKRNIMILIFLIISLFFTLSVRTQGEEKDIAELLRACMEQHRGPARKITKSVNITDELLQKSDPNKILDVLAPYENDPEWSVRHTNHLIIASLADIHPSPKIRQEVATRLVKAALNKADGSAGTLLMEFRERDFNDTSKNIIREYISKDTAGTLVVKLCGIANIKESLPRLEKLLIDEVKYQNDPNMKYGTPWYYTTEWHARLARARMGVKEDIDKCVNLIEREININKKWQLLDNLGYIRQPKAIESLKKYTLSNLRLPSTTDKKEGELYASYIINILADNLENFPIPKREQRGYKQDQIELCRKWMSEQKEWKIIR